ncbi:hypothetical protein FRD01_10965 [Microvenator marinus]|jgi:hypothetical protein|uniref:Roadblock/LAMTOR2 domain-containing protein n=1 Tax=Microvenator marinus TaxID=2600177 RepID=A0A5B8XQF4_9DELT|nr:hypothetical protein [Microvenator marinus]QED27744.1 hypothetical protein FRD01_10965 [Microvenator marinus]
MEETNRRSRRSEDPTTATEFQLQQVIEDFGLENCVLVDEAGSVAASAVSPTETLTDWVRGFPNIFDDGSRPDHQNASACEFRAAGRRMFLATIGAQGPMRDVALYRAVLGIRRIFG